MWLTRLALRNPVLILMMSLMTMVHEETHGYDFANSSVSTHAYVLRSDLTVSPPELHTWTRSEILPLITDDSTKACCC